MKDYFGYNGKVVVVSGAASGMGKAATEMLVDLGARVYALDWNRVAIDGIEEFIQVDLSDRMAIDAAFALIPDHIDSFFGIAGVSGIQTDFNKTVMIDFVANKYICEEYLAHRMSEGGAIAFITSTAGLGWEKLANIQEYLPLIQATSWENCIEVLEGLDLNGLSGPLAYSFSKLAMNYYVAYLQALFTRKHIRVNALLPGSTDTGLTGEFAQAAGGAENLLNYTGYAGRLACSREMAEPVVFLNSEMASYLSGELMVVDYGSAILTQSGIQEDPMGGMSFDMIKAYYKK